MNNKTANHGRSAIDLQSTRNENAQLSGLVARWKQMWQSLAYRLQKSDEPKVWQRRDRYGNVWWVVYDPLSGRAFPCATEQEVRLWLEQTRHR